MDATLSYGLPRVNQSGTLLEGIVLWGELKPELTQQALVERAMHYCDWAVARRLLAIRPHVDVCDERLLAVEALLEVKRRVKPPYLDMQLVAFPQDGVLRSAGAFDNLKRAIGMGVDVVVGIPHFERTMADGAALVKLLCEFAAEKSLHVDMHCDESDDPMSRHIETLAAETHRLGMQGRVTGSHLTSMHSMDNYYVGKLISLMRDSGVAAIANPLINITLQGRSDTYPKRRGMTRMPELMAAGIDVAFGHDCVMDRPMVQPRFRRHAGSRVHGSARRANDQRRCDARMLRMTTKPAKILGLEGYGIEVGCHADCVIFDARDPIEAIRLRAVRTAVIRRGKVISRSPAVRAALSLEGRPAEVNFRIER